MKKIYKTITAVGLGFCLTPVYAIDLLGVYQQALISDPTFQIARAQWMSDSENVPISRSALLPMFDIKAGYDRIYNDQHSPDSQFYTNSSAYSLTLTQPLFNVQLFSQLRQAKSSYKASTANYATAGLDLVFRTTSSYLAILQANDVLRYSVAEKKALASQLAQTKAQFEVGLATITSLNQVQAQYDAAVASEIQARNDLAVKKEELSKITGRSYTSYAHLAKDFPLVYPNPNQINKWIDFALRQNYSIQADQYSLEAARENITGQASGAFPTINASGSYSYENYGNNTNLNSFNYPYARANTAQAGISLDFPVIQGGGTIARTRQAEHGYEQAMATLEQTRRQVISDTSQDYLNIVSGIETVKADKQAVISAQSAYKSTLAGYTVGTSTMMDVLQQLSNLYSAEKTYTIDQYTYINNTLALKQQTGTLSIADIRTVNSWLQDDIGSKENYSANETPEQVKRKVITVKKADAAINSGNYTIQVMAEHNIKALNEFANANGLSNSRIFKITSRGQEWYILVLGDYNSMAKAKTALSELPGSIQSMHPWVRSYASINNVQVK